MNIPKRGEDEQIDTAFARAWEAMSQVGGTALPHDTAARLGLSTENYVYRMLAFRVLQKRGDIPWNTDIEDAIGGEALAKDTPPKPTIDLRASRDVSLDGVLAAEDGIWYDDPGFIAFIDAFIAASSAGKTHGGLIISGPSGEGKTQSALRAFTRAGKRVFKMDCPTVTDPQKWVGRREITDSGTTFIESDFLTAVQRGDGILLDEFNRIPAFASNLVMSLLDSTETLALADLGLTIRVPPETVFIATVNQGTQFGGTHRMDQAHRERFPYTLERDFPPVEWEVKIVASQSGCSEEAAAFMVERFAVRTREMWQTGDLAAPVSTRTLVAAGRVVAMGFSISEALERTAIGMANGNADGTVGAKSEKTMLRNLLVGLGA